VKRLTNETVVQLGNDRRTSWTYDRTGNRLTQTKSVGPASSPTGTATTTYVYDANDRLETETLTLSGTVPGATVGTTTYTYDAAGNTTKKVSPTETIDYVYDDANRMAELQTLAGDVTRYTYAHDGIRLSQTTNATGSNPKTTHYLIDPNQPYAQVIEEAERQGTGALTVKALYAVGDDRIRRYTPAVAAGGGNPGVPAGLRYYHADGLGSTRLLTDETAAITDRTTFEAFGELDAAASAQTSDNAFLYTGEQLDPNSGFYYLRARYINPSTGRFTQQDGFLGFEGDPSSLHKYAYTKANPISWTDPSGNVTLGEINATLNVIGKSIGRALSVVNIVNRVVNTLNAISMLGDAVRLVASGDLSTYEKQLRDAMQMDRQMAAALSEASLSRAAAALKSQTGNLMLGMLRYKTKGILSDITNDARHFVVFMPTPSIEIIKIPRVELPTGIAMSVLGPTGKPIRKKLMVQFGGKKNTSGRLIGFGSNSKGDDTNQYFRMDYIENPHDGPGKRDCMTPWSHDGFQFHIPKPCG
jgi:RHS repeat-associated protein